MNNLWEKKLYRSPIQFLIDRPIYEYDISKANISVLRDANAISEEQYQYYYNAPKLEREIAIGNLQGRDKTVTDILNAGITNARRIFFEMNNIDPAKVLFIRNDSITVVGNPVKYTDITERVRFRLAGEYTSYYDINRIDLLYKYDIVSGSENLEAKGLGDEGIELHRHFMLELLSELFYAAQIEGVHTAILLLQMVYANYLNKELNINFYREFNPGSLFKIAGITEYDPFYADYLTDTPYDKNLIDISYNESILRYINRIYSSVYFSQKR